MSKIKQVAKKQVRKKARTMNRIDVADLLRLVAILYKTGAATSASGAVKAVRAAGVSARGNRIKEAWGSISSN